jgi:hypothetical protein
LAHRVVENIRGTGRASSKGWSRMEIAWLQTHLFHYPRKPKAVPWNPGRKTLPTRAFAKPSSHRGAGSASRQESASFILYHVTELGQVASLQGGAWSENLG